MVVIGSVICAAEVLGIGICGQFILLEADVARSKLVCAIGLAVGATELQTVLVTMAMGRCDSEGGDVHYHRCHPSNDDTIKLCITIMRSTRVSGIWTLQI